LRDAEPADADRQLRPPHRLVRGCVRIRPNQSLAYHTKRRVLSSC
jgi:hypothetical protein